MRVAFLLILLLAPAPAQRSASQSAATFKGAITTSYAKRRFESFLYDHRNARISINLTLSVADWDDLGLAGDDRLYICVCWREMDGGTGGSELIIDLSGSQGDVRLNESARSIRGHIKIHSISGPRQGLMSFYSKPVLRK